MALVISVALIAVVAVSSRTTRLEFRRLEAVRQRPAPAVAPAQVAALEEHHRRTGGWNGVEPLLAQIAASGSEEAVLADGNGTPAAVSPGLRGRLVTVAPGGAVRLERVRGRAGVHEVLLARGPRVALRDAHGRTAGTLHLVPRERAALSNEEKTFARSVNRWLLLGAAGGGILALALTAAMSRRILRPVEELTAAARQIEAGDRGARVRVRSGDEVGRLAAAFNSMAEAVRKTEELRRGMVNDVAHELRTPLTNLRCQLEALQDGLVPLDRAAVDSLHEEALLLGRLVGDLQDLALAEAGQLPLALEDVRLAPVAEAALTAVRPLAAARGVDLRSDVPADLPPARADRERLGQILRNLLTNGIAHTPAGGAITVGGAMRGAHVEVAVSDTGSGISAEQLPHVFERFYRTDPSRSRASGGAGLGLSIVRQLVQAHGGEVGAESAPGKGSTFRFTLPRATA